MTTAGMRGTEQGADAGQKADYGISRRYPAGIAARKADCRQQRSSLPGEKVRDPLSSFLIRRPDIVEHSMAQKIQTLFIDDIDGGDADGTVRFALEGTEYEIDLSAKHSDELRDALKHYITHARKVGGAARRGSTRGGRKPSAIDTV